VSQLLCDIVPSPLGPIRLLGTEEALQQLFLTEDGPPEGATMQPNFGGFANRLRAYFDGDIEALESLPAAPPGTPFQQQVWQTLRSVGPGRTVSYGELAQRIGRPRASRAVGLANARNPVALVIPCHRVIGAGGKLTGYAYGLDRKRWLLRHEGALLL
jgi:methylated-DNA-[protein]-cysteine S-methyltransferase